MLELAKYSLDAKGPGLEQSWYPNTSTVAVENNVGFAARHTYIIKKPDPKGSFHSCDTTGAYIWIL